MKILQNIASLKKSNGGTTFFVSDLSLALAKLGEEVSLVSEVEEHLNEKEALYLPPKDVVNVILTKIKNNFFKKHFFNQLYLDEIQKQLNEVSVVHITGLWTLSMHKTIKLAKKKNLPIIISPQGMLEPWALNNEFWKKKIAWYLYQKKDLNFAKVLHATAYQEAENLRNLGFKQPIAIIPNCINFEKLRKINKNFKSKIKIEKDIDDNCRYILFLSRIHPKKGLLQLIEAWDKIRPHGWKVIIAGPDENGHRLQLEKIIQKKNLINQFKFTGEVNGEEKNNLYRLADLFILPTFSENFGIVVAEALSFGIPVITTKASPWKVIENLNCGWWIETGTESIGKALREALISSPQKLAEMGQRGKVYADNTFDSIMVAKQMLEVYRWMLGYEKKPDFVI